MAYRFPGSLSTQHKYEFVFPNQDIGFAFNAENDKWPSSAVWCAGVSDLSLEGNANKQIKKTSSVKIRLDEHQTHYITNKTVLHVSTLWILKLLKNTYTYT